ncbi:MAG: TatD family hydrolase [Phycisphaerales bacterium]|nr:TatD family hydrolase [Phycisphaerales bacterium]
MIDTHCHLTFPDFIDRIGPTLDDASRAGVSGCITISTTTLDCLDALAIAKAHERVWCSSGVHPLYSDTADPRASSKTGTQHVWESLRTVASHPKCVAWGELGLDNHYPTPAKAIQLRVLEEQLAFIISVNHAGPGGIGKPGLPVVIHCREAFDDLMPILKSSTLPAERFVFHCFTGTPAEARRVLDFGACISFTGIATYPSAADVRTACALVPADRIMIETDAPFLPPLPHRGKRPCVPAYAADTARNLAALRGVSFESFHEQINANTARLFGVR